MTKITIVEDVPEPTPEEIAEMEARIEARLEEGGNRVPDAAKGMVPREVVIPRHVVDKMAAEGIDIEELVAAILKDMGGLQ